MKENIEENRKKRAKTRQRKKKRGKGSSIFWIALILLCFVIIGISIFQLVSIFLEYKAGTDEYDDLKQYVLEEIPEDEREDSQEQHMEGDEENAETEERLQRVSFAELKEINEDIVAWVEIPGTYISYPVMHTSDDSYYLNHTFSRKINSAGSIFMETLNAPDFSDYHTIMYGHNMKNDSMFGSLSDYKSPTYLASHPYVYVDTPDQQMVYQIFSCYETSPDSDSYTIGFAPDDTYQKFLNILKERSLYDTGVSVSSEDKIVTLSTCSRNGEMRFVIHAKQV